MNFQTCAWSSQTQRMQLLARCAAFRHFAFVQTVASARMSEMSSPHCEQQRPPLGGSGSPGSESSPLLRLAAFVALRAEPLVRVLSACRGAWPSEAPPFERRAPATAL